MMTAAVAIAAVVTDVVGSIGSGNGETAIAAVITATIVRTAAVANEEIHHHQPSSLAAASCCPVTQTFPSTFLAVAMGMARVVTLAWC